MLSNGDEEMSYVRGSQAFEVIIDKILAEDGNDHYENDKLFTRPNTDEEGVSPMNGYHYNSAMRHQHRDWLDRVLDQPSLVLHDSCEDLD